MFDTSDPTYRDLKARVLRSGSRVVPFVGAGLSVYGAPTERLPLWRELIDRLIDEGRRLGLIDDGGDPAIDAALAAGRYIEAMDRVLGALGEPTFKRVVERELDDREKPMPPAIAELVGVGWSLIVTTNLDRLITRAYLERHGRPMDAFTSLDTHRLAAALSGTLTSEETLLAQIHGALDVYPSWRLTNSHYAQLLQEPGYTEALKQLFLRQVFFVGFGLQDDDLDLVLPTVAAIYPAGVGEFYALLPRSRRLDPVVQHLVREHGLRPVFYDIDPDPAPDDPFGGHRAAFDCLADLAQAWASGDREFDVTLKYFAELDPNVVGRDSELAALERALVGQPATVIQVVGMGGVGKTSLIQQLVQARGASLARAGYRRAFGCSFHRADVGQFVQDLATCLLGAAAASLPELARLVCEHLARSKTLLLLDGIEVLVGADLALQNPYLDQILDAAIQGHGSVLCTTRVPLSGARFDARAIVEVPPLSESAVDTFLTRWGMDELGDVARRRLSEVTAGHPLALRVLAGVLDDVPAVDAVATIERSAVIDVADEVDPLRENRLAQVIGSYVDLLDDTQTQLLIAATIFDEPVSFQLLASTVTRPYRDSDANSALVGVDLRPIVIALLERRLLTVSEVGELACHPTVRQYFARAAEVDGIDLSPLHRHVAGEYLSGAADRADTFAQAQPLLAACRHAAACEDWTLFEDVFQRRLMHGYIAHLCDYLGAWDETLAVARLAAASPFSAAAPRGAAYYPLTVARSLKHLGRSGESRSAYLSGLRPAATARDPETALYVNNLLTLLIWRGELDAADSIAPLNVRALSWIVEEWQHRWQIEHGCSSLAYLRLLQGDLDAAERLFDRSERAWDDYAGERVWVWDYYPFHHAELVLLRDPDGHGRALSLIEALLTECVARAWPEPECRGHIHAAAVELDRAARLRDPVPLQRTEMHLESASTISAGMSVADVEITYQLTRLKAALVRRDVIAKDPLDLDEFDRMIARVQLLVSSSGLSLAEPELSAARGLVAFERGDRNAAIAAWDQALARSRAQGNVLAVISPRSLVAVLGRRLGLDADQQTTPERQDLIEMMGQEFKPEAMLAALAALETPGHQRAPK